MNAQLQQLTSIINGLTLKINIGTFVIMLMLATAATIGGCNHV